VCPTTTGAARRQIAKYLARVWMNCLGIE
jgi:hypothetical protein